MSRHKVYLRPSVTDLLRKAPSEEAIHVLLLKARTELCASEATKRRWMKAANARLQELRMQALMKNQPHHYPDGKLIVSA